MQRLLIFHKAIATTGAVLVMFLMFIIVIDSGGRFIFDKPLPGAVEVSMITLAWIVFLPLGYALVQGAHVRVSVLLVRYRPRFRLVAEGAITLLSLALFSIAAYAGWNDFWESFQINEAMPAPIWIPYWAARLAIPFGCFIMSVQLAINLAGHHRESGKGKT